MVLPRFKGFADIVMMPGAELVESLGDSYHHVGMDETMVITRSNKRANIYNNGIRNMVLDREEELSSGDMLMIVKNNYFWTEKEKKESGEGSAGAVPAFLANGDRAKVLRVSNYIELYGFRFATLLLQLPDYYNDLVAQGEISKPDPTYSDPSVLGNANTCTGAQGAENALRMAKAAAKALGIKCEDVITYSTGVIGAQFDVTKVENNMEILKNGLSKKGHEEARVAIMTTDTHYKECAVEFEIDGKICRMGTMCKGSGMIHINMGTMLSFITTDCAISSKMLDKALHSSILETYNCVSVDGDTSTNDTLTHCA